MALESTKKDADRIILYVLLKICFSQPETNWAEMEQ